jgi:hypothetical protein
MRDLRYGRVETAVPKYVPRVHKQPRRYCRVAVGRNAQLDYRMNEATSPFPGLLTSRASRRPT